MNAKKICFTRNTLQIFFFLHFYLCLYFDITLTVLINNEKYKKNVKGDFYLHKHDQNYNFSICVYVNSVDCFETVSYKDYRIINSLQSNVPT